MFPEVNQTLCLMAVSDMITQQRVIASSSVSASVCVHLFLIIKLKRPPVMVLGAPLDSL